MRKYWNGHVLSFELILFSEEERLLGDERDSGWSYGEEMRNDSENLDSSIDCFVNMILAV